MQINDMERAKSLIEDTLQSDSTSLTERQVVQFGGPDKLAERLVES